MEYKNYACIALTQKGAELAARLAEGLPGGADVYLPRDIPSSLSEARRFDAFPVLIKEIFSQYRGHIFVTAAGIAVRGIAPLLKGKNVDPYVLVCDERGQFCISLLTGPVGDGNKLARRVAGIMGGTAVITAVTDVEELPALDLLAREAGCRILDWPEVKAINAAILGGEEIEIYDPLRIIAPAGTQAKKPSGVALEKGVGSQETALLFASGSGSDSTESALSSMAEPSSAPTPGPVLVPVADIPIGPRPGVAVHWRHVPARPGLLRLAVPALHIGVGCGRGVAAEDVARAIGRSLEAAGLEPAAVAALASIERENDEQGLLEAARTLALPLHFFSAAHLAGMPVKNPPDKASEHFGRDHPGICESAALASARSVERHACLVTEKAEYGNVAIAIAVNMKFF